jgi:hypothetical protein
MIAREAFLAIARARREGVALSVRADGKLGLKADRAPSGELLAVLKEHKADILALLPPPPSAPPAGPPLAGAHPAIERAKQMTARLRALAFWPYLSAEGVLLLADETGRRRSVADYLPIGAVFDDLNAGLDEDPRLLDPYEPPNWRGK